MRETVPITFDAVAVVRTAADLEVAVGHLTTSVYACVLDLEPEYLETMAFLDGVTRFNDVDLTLRALKLELMRQNQNTRWSYTSGRAGGEVEEDFGLHNDPSSEGQVTIDYHVTDGKTGGIEATFAKPTQRYCKSDKERMTQLLRDDRTDQRLAVPESFRQVTLEHGGKIAFTLDAPGLLAQLHDIRSLSPRRKSKMTFIDGHPGVQDPYAKYLLSLVT